LTTVHTLASGSSGNAALFCGGGVHLLLDAGISCRRIATGLQALGLRLEDLTAILVTHTHADHISGLQTLLKRSQVPILASEAAARDLAKRLPISGERLRTFSLGSSFSLGACTITPFATSHDAPGACGFRLDTADGSAGVLTDTGYVTQEAATVLPGVDLILLEANHDVETLESGPYPPYLKQRILGERGHLSNESAARFAVVLAQTGASHIVLAHLSRENNTPAMAQTAVETALSAAGLSPLLTVAPRDSLGGAYSVHRRSPCEK
jgi:phosphoribosyl 1,2-cyclic phosphodiesterase